MISSKEILSINLRYYRQKYNLSQEKFAEVLGTTLVYINQIENCKRKPTIVMLDKIVSKLNNYDKNLNLTTSDLLKYQEEHITNYSRVDEKNPKTNR